MALFEAMGQMDSVSIGLWVTGFMLFFVIIGMRVAFAAAIAGFIGLVWIFSAKMGFERGVVVAMKMAGTIPHSKVSTLALSLIPTFILIGFLAYHAGLTRALFEAAKRWVGWLPGGMG
ncbi:C4-dicarboxylate ABC transporter permease, partial [Solemya velum gill symbiont]